MLINYSSGFFCKNTKIGLVVDFAVFMVCLTLNLTGEHFLRSTTLIIIVSKRNLFFKTGTVEEVGSWWEKETNVSSQICNIFCSPCSKVSVLVLVSFF